MKKNIITALTLCVCFMAGTGCAQDKGSPKGGAPVDSTQAIADRIVASKIPVVLDFWAGWCGPCRFLDPIIEELEREYRGKALFMKINVDTQFGITQYFKVSSIPTVFIIEDKTVRAAFPGVRDKKTYKNAIEDALKLSADRKP